MLLAAPPVAELAGVVGERVDGTFARQDRQRSVHGGETRSLASVAEARVEGLRGEIVLLAHQLGEDERPRPGRPHPEALEKGPSPLHVLLGCARHSRYCSSPGARMRIIITNVE